MRRFAQVVIIALVALTTIVLTGHNSSALAKEFDHSHPIYDSLLKKYVHNAKVDYRGFIESKEKFQTYLEQLGSVDQIAYKGWSKEQKLAFWINAYNAFTVKAIIDYYPIDRRFDVVSLFYPENSIRQIDGVWDKLKFQAAGKWVTLNQIEHEILRKQFNEPRIHVAINCASMSCPDLRAEAYIADKINEQLESQATGFVSNTEKGVMINPDNGTVKLSKIFKWFGEDFIQNYGNTKLFEGRSKQEKAVLNFVRTHIRSEKERAFLESNKFKVSHLDYDWSLNDLKGQTS